MIQYLTESENYKVTSENETVYLHFKQMSRQRKIIGDFYGNVETALISCDESFVVMGGCGLIVYFLQEPFGEYKYTDGGGQYFEVHRYPPDVWWIDAVYQTDVDMDSNFFRFVVALDDGYRILRMDVRTKSVTENFQ